MNFESFISKQLDLIEIEKNAEIEESKALLSSCSLQRLQIKGLCLLKLKIDSKFTGLYGRTIVVLNSAVPGKVINTQHFSSGDIVSISENSISPSQLNGLKNVISGTVTKVTPQSVSVAIDNEIESVDDQLNDSDTYKIIKLSNDITHKRIKNALSCLKQSNKLGGRSAHLVDILFQSLRPERTNLDSAAQSFEGIAPGQFWSNFKFFNAGLDESQQDAVRFTFEQKDLAIIHGPPGTGKTTTLIEIIKQNCLKYNQKILCCAPSNIAVDNLVERLINPEPGYKRMKFVRLGHPARLLEHIQDYSLDSVLNRSEQYGLANDVKKEMDQVLKSIKKSSTQRGERESLKREMRDLRKELRQREDKAMKQVLQSCDCVLATLTTAHEDGPLRHIDENHFDIIIIDECSQAMEASCYIPLIKGARKLIIAGDHLQLPPTIISKEAAEKGLDLTLMKRLIDAYGDECTKMLTTQYRMNKLIMQWISQKLYDSRLVAHAKVAEHLLCELPDVQKTENTSSALVLIDTHGCDDCYEMVASSDDPKSSTDEESKANDGEANLVCLHVSDLIRQGLKQEDIAVITPYNLQMELIKAKLHSRYSRVEVKSVDGFQGREKEAVVISLVRSNTRGEVGFLSDERRINVAITRARRHLCVVCDTHTCRSNAFLKSFLDYCEENAVIRSAFDYENLEGDDSGGQEASYDLGFDEIKFQKLRVATSTTKKTPASKGDGTPKARPPRPFVETEEDIKFKEECTKIIEDLKASSNTTEHQFSSGLTARQRRIVHELAETHKLFHASKGEDDQRYIILSTKPIRVEKNETPKKTEAAQKSQKDKVDEEPTSLGVESSADDSLVRENKFDALQEDEPEAKVSKNKLKKLMRKQQMSAEKASQKAAKEESDAGSDAATTPKPKKEASNLLGEIADQNDFDLKYRNDCKPCPNCEKFILKSNYAMHELHCTKVSKAPSQAAANLKESKAGAGAGGGGSGGSTTSKKAKPVKKDPLKTTETEDFDELLDMLQKSNTVCNFQGCKAKTSVLGSNCEFCKVRFCLSHSIAEAHGCGDEAKKQARAHIRKTGNLDVNEKQTTYMQQVRHKYVEKKFHEKLEAMQAARTGTDKKQNKK